MCARNVLTIIAHHLSPPFEQINTMQFLMLAISRTFSWPSYLRVLFQSINTWVGAMTGVLSLDCLIDGAGIEGYISKSTVGACISLLTIVLGVLVAFYLFRVRRRNRIVFESAVMCILFLLHADLAVWTLNFFVCTSVDATSKRVLTSDYSYQCHTRQHLTVLLSFGLLSILVLVAIPAVALLRMRKLRAHLSRHDVLVRFSFLIRGYRPRFFYWELFILARRIVVVAIVALVDDIALQTQAVICVLICALMLHFNAQPFTSRAANRYETTSIVVVLVIFNAILFALLTTGATGFEHVLIFIVAVGYIGSMVLAFAWEHRLQPRQLKALVTYKLRAWCYARKHRNDAINTMMPDIRQIAALSASSVQFNGCCVGGACLPRQARRLGEHRRTVRRRRASRRSRRSCLLVVDERESERRHENNAADGRRRCA
jgi:hypothetical protein